ncbi:MAG: response regulator [Blastochloris sp.]|nr:response regulator [Blastochloris sp.]
MKVLLAEDEQDLQLITRLALEDAGYEVTAVGDGLAVLDALRHQNFDVVLLDVMMPRMDGFTAFAELRRNPATQHVPVIFLTAKPQIAAVSASPANDANGYILKPFDIHTLAERVSALLGK